MKIDKGEENCKNRKNEGYRTKEVERERGGEKIETAVHRDEA